MSAFLQDLRLAARTLAKAPGYGFVVVLTLALAIGANTVIFSFADVLLLRPLPIRNAEHLGWVFGVEPQRGTERARLTLHHFLDLRERARSFTDLGAATPGSLTLTGHGEPRRLTARFVTANLLDIWGVDIAHGRRFVGGEDAPGAARVAVMSHGFWTRQLASDTDAIGSALMLDGEPYTVVGVLSPAIEIGNLAEIDVWVPLTIDRAAPGAGERRFSAVGRLAQGTTVAEADAEVRTISTELARDYQEQPGWTAHVLSTRASISGPETPLILAMLVTVVAFVLAIACANLANLTLARVASRTKELAVRAALGASRVRLVRQLVTESLLLSLAGGALSLGIAHGGFVAMRAASSEGLFQLVDLDVRLFAFAAALAFLAPLLFSLPPALRSSRTDLNRTLQEEGTRGTAGRTAGRGRAALVVTQVALACMLLVVAGLLLRTLVNLTAVDAGFDTARVLVTSLEAPAWKHRSDDELRQFYRALQARLEELPGVAAGASTHVPSASAETPVRLEIAGRPVEPEGERPWAARAIVTPGYFEAVGLGALRGRLLRAEDDERAPAVAVVSRETARRYWTSEDDAIGARVRLEHAGDGWIEIVGVVRDLANPDPTRPANPQILVPYAQHPTRAMSLLVRAGGAPEGLTGPVRERVRSVDPDAALGRVATVQSRLDEERSSSLVLIGLFLAFGVVALALASAGLYGVISYGVSQRTREIGIRLALGAVPADIRRMIGGQGALLVGVGIAIGAAGGFLLGLAMQTLLYGIGAADPATFAVVLVTLLSVSALATWIPSRRAMRIDPARTLRA